jgi:hypothetical protein
LHIDQSKAEFIWQRMVVLLRALIWFKHGVNPQDIVTTVTMLEHSAQWCSLADLHRIVETLYAHEELFFKTAMQQIFLEMILLGLCQKDNKKTSGGDGSAPCTLGILPAVEELSEDDEEDDEEDEDEDEDSEEDDDTTISYDEQWVRFVAQVETLNDALLNSLFKQAQFIAYDTHTHKVSIELSKDFVLFKEWLENSQETWQPLLRTVFPREAMLNAQFTGTHKIERDKKIVPPQEKTPQQRPQEQPSARQRHNNNNKTVVVAARKHEERIDVSDERVWKKASMLLRHFPGIITEIRENR